MKKFISKILLIIPFLFISYVLLLIVWGSFAPSFIRSNLNYGIAGYGHMYSRISEVRQIKDVDILFLGSSHTYRGFDPRIFREYGYKTFNLGSPNQTPQQTEVLLERYINTLNPKLIIYETNPRTFTYDGVESSLDLLANDKIDMKSLKMALKINNVRTYNSLLYGYYRQLFNKNKNIKEDPVKGDDLYISGGYVEKDLSYKRKRPAEYGKLRWNPLKSQLISFENIIKLINKKKIKLILVQAPITRLVFDQYDEANGRIDAYLSGKTPNYYNFNYLLKMDDGLHYFDSHHLNQYGVRIFNEEIIKKVIPKVQQACGSSGKSELSIADQ